MTLVSKWAEWKAFQSAAKTVDSMVVKTAGRLVTQKADEKAHRWAAPMVCYLADAMGPKMVALSAV